MEVSFYLKRPEATESTALFARISYFNQQLKYYPSIKIHPKDWNKEKKQARQTLAGYANFNRRLKEITNDVEDCMKEYQNQNEGKIPQPDKFKEILDTRLKNIETKTYTLQTYFQKFIDDSKSGVRVDAKSKKRITPSTVTTYVGTQNILNGFIAAKKRKVDFDKIDLDFYSDFVKYLQNTKKLSVNTIGKHIKVLKTVLNEATEDPNKINTKTDFKSTRFSKVSELSDNIYLNEIELIKLANIDLSNEPSLDRVRDLFLVGCYTGLRFSDFSVLRPEQIKDGYITTTQIKTGEEVVIPIHSKVEQILEKYKGILPNAISNQKMNDYLKDITKKMPELQTLIPVTATKAGQTITTNYPKWKMVSTHTARRSFATNEFEAGTPTIIIMAITGHKTESAFLKYIKTKPKDKATILKGIWANRENPKLIKLTA